MQYLGLIFGIIVSNYAANMAGLDSARIFIATVLLTIPFLVGAQTSVCRDYLGTISLRARTHLAEVRRWRLSSRRLGAAPDCRRAAPCCDENSLRRLFGCGDIYSPVLLNWYLLESAMGD